MIEQSEIETLKEYTDIVAVAEQLGMQDLKQTGRAFVGLCIFHDERTGSMCVYPDDCNFYCHGCGAHGDAIAMIQKSKGCTFTEAVHLLSEWSGYVPAGLIGSDGEPRAKHIPTKKPEPRLKPDKRFKWRTILPVPKHAPELKLSIFDAHFKKHAKTLTASKLWAFRDCTGQLLGVDVRYDYFDKPKIYKAGDTIRILGKETIEEVIEITDAGCVTESGTHLFDACERKTKDVITWTWCEQIEKKFQQWRMRKWDAQSPLYGLDRLCARKDDTVIICEGCKAADAADIIDGYVGMTWRGGAETVAKFGENDWAMLADRDCIIWPDADEIGRRAAVNIYQHLTKINARSIRIIETNDLPKGWDLDDASA